MPNIKELITAALRAWVENLDTYCVRWGREFSGEAGRSCVRLV
jgi:hypothetical protein